MTANYDASMVSFTELIPTAILIDGVERMVLRRGRTMDRFESGVPALKPAKYVLPQSDDPWEF